MTRSRAKPRIPSDDPKAEVGDFSRPRPADAMDKLARRAGWNRAAIVEIWKERAAIKEYLGGMNRAEAELAAMRELDEVIPQRPAQFAYTGGIRYVPDEDGYW